MSISDEVRRGNTQSAINVDNIGALVTSVLITGIVAGYRCDSWWVFLGVFLGSLLLMSAASYHTIPTIMWSIATGLLWVDWIWDWADLLGTDGAYCIAILVFLCGAGVCLSGMQGVNDTNPVDSPTDGVENIIIQIVGMSAVFGVYYYGLPI